MIQSPQFTQDVPTGFQVTLPPVIAQGNFTFSGSKIRILYLCFMYAEKPQGARSLNSVEVI